MVAHRVDEDIEGELRARMACGRRLFQVANVAAQPADARESRLRGQQRRHRVGVEVALLHDEERREHVEIADAVILRESRLRRQAEAGFNSHAVTNARHAGTAAEMAGDVAHASREQGLHALCGRTVARPVEPVTADAQRFLPFVRNGIGGGRGWHPFEKRRLEQRDQRRPGQHAAEGPHRGHVWRVVRGRQERHCLHGRQHLVVDEAGAGDGSRMHGFEADRGQVGQTAQWAARTDEIADGALNCGVVIGT